MQSGAAARFAAASEILFPNGAAGTSLDDAGNRSRRIADGANDSAPGRLFISTLETLTPEFPESLKSGNYENSARPRMS